MPCSRFILRGFALAALVASGVSVAALGRAEAGEVYCSEPGVPAGCVQRPASVVACTRPGYPVGCKPGHVPVMVCKWPDVPAGCTGIYPGQTMLEPGVLYPPAAIGGLIQR